MPSPLDKIRHCDIFIAGGGLGACAAALRAAQWGHSVTLVEPCDWIGGQVSSQGVSALDEHRWIEEFGATANYYRFRQAIRRHYQLQSPEGFSDPSFNPGQCWVSRLSFEPAVAQKILEEMLQPFVLSGQVQIFRAHTFPDALVRDGHIESLTIAPRQGPGRICQARCYIDASELGDLLPLVGAPYRAGAEARGETGEPHAPEQAHPDWIQSFTFPFIVAFRPGENHTIAKPADYEKNRREQPYTLNAGKGAQGEAVIYKMFGKTAQTPGGFWEYRRLIAAQQFAPQVHPHDLSMINWHSNDYRGASLIDVTPAQRERAVAAAKALSLGFLYWLQTEAPRDDGGRGYPELQLRPDLMGSADGLSQHPYIRESRRIRALETLREQDIMAAAQSGARARLYPNSVAIGHYWLDIHKSRHETEDLFAETRPFQVPLGALIPQRPDNLIAGAKNIGTTRLSNGACRLHPIEWAIGEAAGALASFGIRQNLTPGQIHASLQATRSLQRELVQAGAPLFWFVDLPHTHPAFAAVQWLTVAGIIEPMQDHLLFEPDQPVGPECAAAWLQRARASGPVCENAVSTGRNRTRAEFAQRLFEQLRITITSTFEA